MKRATVVLFSLWLVLFPGAPFQGFAGSRMLVVSDEEYRIHLHDTVQIRVLGQSELDTKQEVRPDGGISLPLLGNVMAVGKTPSELDRIITEKYGKYLVNPEVAVVLRSFNLDRVYVGGEVNHPGELRFAGRLTLVQALFASGGPRETASLSRCFIIRNLDTSAESRDLIDIRKILKNQLPDPVLGPFDVVVIPESRISQAGRYVDQVVNRMIPRNFRLRLQEYYNLKPQLSNDFVGGFN